MKPDRWLLVNSELGCDKSMKKVVKVAAFSNPAKCRLISTSVTRLGHFYNFLATNCLTKVAQIFCWFLGYF